MTLTKLIASGFGSGLVRRAPGTFGSCAALVLWITLAQLDLLFGLERQLALVGVTFAVGIWTTSQVLKQEFHSARHIDPQFIVIDEWAGLFVSLLGVLPYNWYAAVCGLLLFRVFDILKPWPISRLEQVSGAWGIMLDDILAGVFACAIVNLVM